MSPTLRSTISASPPQGTVGAARASEVLLSPDGRIGRIILDEGLASALGEAGHFSVEEFCTDARFLAPSPLAAEALRAFFSGADLGSIYARCSLGGIAPWQYRVMQGMAAIRRGKVLSYGGLAKRLGAPGAARAVGNACVRNPLPLLYPCHRVVLSDGRIGAFMSRQGGALKRRLLEFEGIRFDASGRVSPECFE